MVVPAMAATRPNPVVRGDQMLRASVLSAHNQARRQFGVAPLAWSEPLATEALRHAQYMASTGFYGHDRTPGRRKRMGENIWRGQRGLFSYDVMVGAMLGEQRNFRPGPYPNNSRTGNWSDVSHFTQIVWPTTTEIGCALASSGSTDYFVCRYAPAGNKDGVYLAPGQVAELPTGRRSAEGGH
ncbi:MAG TPA: CAP domain-containing protein [Sphingomicrobium sp.]|nr:CAP domain-containing protein [Sphingomicrobium sp.]